MVVEATADNITKVTAFANACMEQWGCPEIFQAQMDIAIDEVFGNIVRYAYPLQTGSAAVQVEVEGEPLTVIITFMDQGVPFDPLARETPDLSLGAEERPLGGLGIYMVKQSMDGIFYEYREGKNILQIRKSFQAGNMGEEKINCS